MSTSMLPPNETANAGTDPGLTPPLDEKQIRAAFRGRATRIAAAAGASAGLTSVVPVLYFVIILGMVYVLGALVIFTRPDIPDGANVTIGLLFRTFMGWFAPVLAAVLVLYYMLKPLFSRSNGSNSDIEIIRDQQPLFFSFIDEVARVTGAAVPARIFLNNEPEVVIRLPAGKASALHLADIELVVGLPLVETLTMRELGAAVASELLMYSDPQHARAHEAIFRSYRWLHQSAAYRDSFDETIEEICESESRYFRPFGWFMRWMVRMIRGVLRGLLHLVVFFGRGQVHSQRFAGDTIAAQICGGMEYTALISKLNSVKISAWLAERNLKRCMTDSLPQNYPAFLRETDQRLPLDIRRLDPANARGKNLAQIEPVASLRIRHLIGSSRNALFALDRKATDLLPNYETLAIDSSLLHYSVALGSDFRKGWLLPNAEFTERLGSKAFQTDLTDAKFDYHEGDKFHKLKTALAGIGSCIAAILILLQAGVKLAEAHEPLEMKYRRNIGLAVMVPGEGFRVIQDVKHLQVGDTVGYEQSYEEDEEISTPLPATEAGLYYDTGDGAMVLCKKVKVHLAPDEIALSEDQEEAVKFVEESWN